MIPTISGQTSFITVSVGHEVYVRDSQKTGGPEVPGVTKNAGIRKELKKFEESQNSRPPSEHVAESVTKLQKTLQLVEPRIELSVDEELNQIIFRVFDKESGELIRQIPSEEILKLDRFYSQQSGLIVEEEI